jgi:hypothetical protein
MWGRSCHVMLDFKDFKNLKSAQLKVQLKKSAQLIKTKITHVIIYISYLLLLLLLLLLFFFPLVEKKTFIFHNQKYTCYNLSLQPLQAFSFKQNFSFQNNRLPSIRCFFFVLYKTLQSTTVSSLKQNTKKKKTSVFTFYAAKGGTP